ncbi:penicillin acylase family protein [Flavisolibacter sp. BT320]|nr:penicillin acylase family protein [Flavisolibacter longurius]
MPPFLTKPLLCLLAIFSLGCSFSASDQSRTDLEERARRVTIIRDDWGIPHIYGKTDADAVFGMMYAQCEENFQKVERAYIEKLGRLSELEGKDYLLQDIKMRLLYDTPAAIADYHQSPPWLKELLQAFSDGIHYYLYKHPETKPMLLNRFEPWYPLLFTDGAYIASQTGGLQTGDLKALFEKELMVKANNFVTDSLITPTGSNAFALAPSRTADGSAMLYINPHVTFYFRTEMHIISEEGLNAYGAVTWGQLFVFQGFNEHCGWMHTSTAVDASDLYEETIVKKGDSLFYAYDGSVRPLQQKQLQLFFKHGESRKERTLTTYATHHGPVVGKRNNKWLSLKANNRSLNGLIQSWQRMKATGLPSFVKTLQLQGNPSTNTMYADSKGNIAYWHGNYIPRRAVNLDPFEPLDGTTSRTEWQGFYQPDSLVHRINPKEGFLQNCNSSPFSVSGLNSIPKEKFPLYMAPEGENFRSLHALKLLSQPKKLTLDALIQIGHNTYLSAFDTLLPPLFVDYKSARNSDQHPALKEAIDSLQQWNKAAATSSVATTIAIYWGWTILLEQQEKASVENEADQVKQVGRLIRAATPAERLGALNRILESLQKAFGTWKLPWGQINRFQRLGGDGDETFDNNKPSLPVGFGPSYLGSLPSYETVWQGNQQYGVAGNSFVAAISFGPKLKAKSISTGGQSFDVRSKHFTDQAELFCRGELKDVYFYKEDVLRHAAKTYHPGEE